MAKYLILFILIGSGLQAQCLQDSVTNNNPATVVTLRPQPPDPCPYCDDCDSSVLVGIPADTGVVIFTNLLGQRDWRVKIISGCGGQVYIDTCIFQMPNFTSVQFAGDWSHGNWMMQICGGEIAYVSWKPGVVHGAAVIAPQPLPCGVLPVVEETGDQSPLDLQTFPVYDVTKDKFFPYNEADSGVLLLDLGRKRKLIKQ